MKLRYS